jgi:N-acetylneuraminate lyase
LNHAGFYVCGSTGEGIYMSVTDRKLVTEIASEHINGRVPFIVHTGTVAITDAIDLAIHAQDHGAQAISSILPPSYKTEESIILYFKALADAVPDLYFLPYLLNPTIDTVTLLRKVMQEVPNLAGTKYTGSNMYEFGELIKLGGGEWMMFSGMDEQCVFSKMMGSSGSIGSTLNYMPTPYKRIRDYCDAGQYAEAHALQMDVNEVTKVMIEHSFLGSLKVVMTRMGFDCGQPRLPNSSISEAVKTSLFEALAETKFDELVAM